MKAIIRFLFLLQVTFYLLPVMPAYAQQEKQTVLDVILHQEQNNVTISSVGKRQGFAPDNLIQKAGYYLQVFDSNGKRINEVRFLFPQGPIIDFPAESTAEIPPQNTNADATVTIPFPQNGRKLVVLSPDQKELATYNLNVFKAAGQSETKKQPIPTTALAAAAAVLILIGLAYIIFQKRKNRPPTTPPLPTNTDSFPQYTPGSTQPLQKPKQQEVINPKR